MERQDAQIRKLQKDYQEIQMKYDLITDENTKNLL